MTYNAFLKKTDLILPHVPDWAEPSWHLYVVQSSMRDLLQAQLERENIGTLIHYPIPPHMQKAYGMLQLRPDDLLLSQRLANQVLSLPIGPQLEDCDVRNIIQTIEKF